ncbi:unnamed protein product [Rotaria socialis]|uniref:Eukaryotic translation initiation factor 2 subunit 2 n=1 Tax=Rotaria socialis TaxID=392032 RepID=A0A819WKQ0_9BILA|nr:unnamed protein product [Rotaria socialis]CAF4126438.1 unnamed protein product [Rotaria socialis]
MCTDIDFLPHIMTITDKDLVLSNGYDRRNSSTPSIASSSSSTTTNNTTSWFERKLFNHFKRLFRRNSFSSKIDSFQSSRRPSGTAAEEIVASSACSEQSKGKKKEEEEEEEEEEVQQQQQENKNTDHESLVSLSSSTSSSTTLPNSINEHVQSLAPNKSSIDLLYDYDRLLTRCLERQKHDLTEMISRCQAPITIPHADLSVGHSRSIVANWKSYTRLFRALNRDSQLFQQYINLYYGCQSWINQREQLTFNVRTTKATFDNVLKLFLNEYVTCLACQKAQTHLIKSTGLWRTECQLCGSQRSVKRLKWKV